MNENESRQWVEEDMGWEEKAELPKLNDAVIALICENIDEIRTVIGQSSNSPEATNIATVTTALWMLRGLEHKVVVGSDPHAFFVSGFLWGLHIQRWADEKGIDLEAM